MKLPAKRNKTTVLTVLGFEIFGLVLAGVLVGRWLDQQFSLKGLGTAAGVLLALVGWLTHLILILKQLAKDAETSDTNRP